MELLLALATLALGVFIFAEAKDFPTLGGYPGPGLFPQILGVMLAASGILLTGQAVRKRAWPRPSLSLLRHREAWNALATIGAVVLYLYVSPTLGFLPTAFVIVGGLMALLGVRLWLSALLGLAAAVLTFLLFHRLLFVPLPYGPVEEWLQPLLFPRL